MIVVKTFVSELSKRIEMLHAQIEVFEKKVSQVKLIENIIEKSTLKDVNEINGDDLALISEHDYKKITEIVHFNNNEENVNKFIEHAVNNRLYAKLLLDGKVDNYLKEKEEVSKLWLTSQANNIKEFILEFKLNNEDYLNSLKLSDNLYKKYLSYFYNDELISPILDVEEFNDVLKKCGLITSEKWQLLKYIAQRNLVLINKNDTKKDNIMDLIKDFLDKEGYLLNDVTEEHLDFCISLIDMDENSIKSLNLTNSELIKYQKIPILYNIKSLYDETIQLINNGLNNKKVEKNKKDLLEFKNSYDFFKKIN